MVAPTVVNLESQENAEKTSKGLKGYNKQVS